MQLVFLKLFVGEWEACLVEVVRLAFLAISAETRCFWASPQAGDAGDLPLCP